MANPNRDVEVYDVTLKVRCTREESEMLEAAVRVVAQRLMWHPEDWHFVSTFYNMCEDKRPFGL